jgi:hypothetical protein
MRDGRGVATVSDPDRIDSLPIGIRHEFWVVAIAKFILETGHLSADQSLRLLKSIHSIPDELGYFNKEVLAMIEPAPLAAYEIFDAASKLGSDEFYKVLTCRETFDILLKLNPSVLKAIEHADERWNRNTVKFDATGAPIPAVAAPSVVNRYFETKPDPRGSHLDESFFRKSRAPKYAIGSQLDPAGPYNIFGGS